MYRNKISCSQSDLKSLSSSTYTRRVNNYEQNSQDASSKSSRTAKLGYSKSTTSMVKMALRESPMSRRLRADLEKLIDAGEPLPLLPSPREVKKPQEPDLDTLVALYRSRNAKRKSLKNILASDAYARPNYRPKLTDREIYEKAKKELQEKMAGVPLCETLLKPKRRSKVLDEEPMSEEMLIDELLNQIKERSDWLEEMEKLGEGKKYRDEMREQIAERLRMIRMYEKKIEARNE